MIRIKKYRSYRGQEGIIAPNLLNRDFGAARPFEKWVTDITEIHAFDKKVYVSPILDLFNGEVISCMVGLSPGYQLVNKMLLAAFENLPEGSKLILHSDQGWQYQMKLFQNTLAKNGVRQSMSRKGNCLDNAAMESFFGIMKSELLCTTKFECVQGLIDGIHEYIWYYNNDRIKLRLKGMSPINYRTHFSVAS